MILVGGLASGALGKELKGWIEKVFYLAGEVPYSILLAENSTYAAIAGCAEYIEKKDSANLIFDFGQSFIKRSIVTKSNGQLHKVWYLSKKPSINMDWVYGSDAVVRRQAEDLNDYLLGIICDTFKEAEKWQVSEEIIISIANYVNKGVLLEGRGGYAKLFLIATNYEKYLSDTLTKRLNRMVKVKLVHDGTAMAAAFKDYKKTVCLSLGTVFGVGYPIG